MKILTSGIPSGRFRASLLIRELEKNRRGAAVRRSIAALFRLDAAHRTGQYLKTQNP
jgi:hypothetical protein